MRIRNRLYKYHSFTVSLAVLRLISQSRGYQSITYVQRKKIIGLSSLKRDTNHSLPLFYEFKL